MRNERVRGKTLLIEKKFQKDLRGERDKTVRFSNKWKKKTKEGKDNNYNQTQLPQETGS